MGRALNHLAVESARIIGLISAFCTPEKQVIAPIDNQERNRNDERDHGYMSGETEEQILPPGYPA